MNTPTPTPTPTAKDDPGPPPEVGFLPPVASDVTFVTDVAVSLDTDCRYRTDGDIEFEIAVTRYVAPTTDGTLNDLPTLVANDVVGQTAELVLLAWDVDTSGAQNPAARPERDKVFLNDVYVGNLAGMSRQWLSTTFSVDTSLVRFPEKGDPVTGVPPVPAVNVVRIEIDSLNEPADRAWCTSVDWGLLRVRALSPLVLIHGNGQSGIFFDDQSFNVSLDAARISRDSSIDMPTDFIEEHVRLLEDLLPRRAAAFGVDSIHIVAHSKGGLDVRGFLAGPYIPKERGGPFSVLSLTTLSTPHEGSALADLVVAQEDSLFILGAGFGANLAILLGNLIPGPCGIEVDNGRKNLTTQFVRQFNRANLRTLPRDIDYYAIGGDADTNNNGRIDFGPDRVSALVIGDSCLEPLPNLVTEFFVNSAYQTLRNIGEVEVEEVEALGLISIGVASAGGDLNDVLVTTTSAGGSPGAFEVLAPFIGGEGRNHATIADQNVAPVILPFIKGTETLNGDFR
jgi:hypothetical protein